MNLGLTIDVTIEIRNEPAAFWSPVHREWWGIDVRPDDCPPPVTIEPWQPTLAAALQNRLTYLDQVAARAVPWDPSRPVPAPASGPARGLAERGLPVLIRRLGEEHAGRPVICRADRRGWRVYLGGAPGAPAGLLSSGSTFRAAVTSASSSSRVVAA